MNDFTKEELKQLMNGVWCTSKVHQIAINKILYDKLNSMIDNYCEHLFINIGESHKPCIKCGMEFK